MDVILLFALDEGGPYGPRRIVGSGRWEAPSIYRLSAEARKLLALTHRIAVPSRPEMLRHAPVRGVLGCAATAGRRRAGCPKSLPSRHMAYKIPASLRASATAAMRLPRRAARALVETDDACRIKFGQVVTGTFAFSGAGLSGK